MDEDIGEDPFQWKKFHTTTREYVIFLLLFVFLYVAAYFFICLFRKKLETYPEDYEDAIVDRIALWLSSFSLSISIGAALLLPISIISNEVLLLYPNSYYIQWLNSSLIAGVWNLVFLFSSISLFIFLPFSHFILESEGFPTSAHGIMARVNEATLVLILTGLVIVGIIYMLSAILNSGPINQTTFTKSWKSNIYGTHQMGIFAGYRIFSLSNYFLPFLYSCVSFVGVLMLLLCTPIGFARLFTVINNLLKRRKMPEDIENETPSSVMLDEETRFVRHNDHLISSVRRSASFLGSKGDVYTISDEPESGYFGDKFLAGQFCQSFLVKKCLYPLVMLVLVMLTALSVLTVAHNTLALFFGLKSLPVYTVAQNLSLGITSLSCLGPTGAFLEIVMILYLYCTSVVGLYSLPLFHRMRPTLANTPLNQIVGNCAVLLVLSSALPVLARSLGITNFDLLEDFGRINWLGNFYIVFVHNVVFVGTVAICLGKKIHNSLYPSQAQHMA